MKTCIVSNEQQGATRLDSSNMKVFPEEFMVPVAGLSKKIMFFLYILVSFKVKKEKKKSAFNQTFFSFVKFGFFRTFYCVLCCC